MAERLGGHGGKGTGNSCGRTSSKHALAAASHSLTCKWLQLKQAGRMRPQNETSSETRADSAAAW